MGKFMQSIDTKLFGRKTYDVSLQLGAKFDSKTRNYVFSRRPFPASVPSGVEFIAGGIVSFAKRLRDQKGKNIWMMVGGGSLLPSWTKAQSTNSSSALSRC